MAERYSIAIADGSELAIGIDSVTTGAIIAQTAADARGETIWLVDNGGDRLAKFEPSHPKQSA